MVATYLSSAEVVELTNLLKLIRELQATPQIGMSLPDKAISLLRQQAEKIIGRLKE
jgi:hypothetical protein